MADVLRVAQHAINRRRRPTLALPIATRYTVPVQAAYDPAERFAVGVLFEDALNSGRCRRLNLHLVALGSRPPLLVGTHLSRRPRTVAERGFANEKPPVLLAYLTSQGLFPEVAEKLLIEDRADLNRKNRGFILAVERVSHGDNAHAVVAELLQQAEQEVVTARQPREIVDQDDVEQRVLGGFPQRVQARPILLSTRLGSVRIHMILQDHEVRGLCLSATARNLILNTLVSLILRAIARIDRSSRHQSSSRDLR